MANRATIEVVGARELRATLKRAGDDLQDFKTAHSEVGRLVGSSAQIRAPKRTGTLAASMRAGAGATSATVKFGSTSVPYAGVIHWGWSAHNIAANPFASEAAEETEPVWLPVYQRRIDQILARVQGE